MGERNYAIDWRRMQSLNPTGVLHDVNPDKTVCLGDRKIKVTVGESEKRIDRTNKQTRTPLYTYRKPSGIIFSRNRHFDQLDLFLSQTAYQIPTEEVS
jgi:hypothetical protein